MGQHQEFCNNKKRKALLNVDGGLGGGESVCHWLTVKSVIAL